MLRNIFKLVAAAAGGAAGPYAGRHEPSRAFFLNDAGLLRHEAVIGKSGAGKSEYLLWRLAQQMQLGGGALVIDAKGDREFRDRLWWLGTALGRASDLRCVNLDDAAGSHTCNPLLRGDEAAVAARFTDTIDVHGSPSAEHFRAQGHLALTAVIAALRSLDLAWCARDLHRLLSQPAALDWLARRSTGTAGGAALTRWLAPWRTRGGGGQIDGEALRQQTGGVIARLFALGTGAIGEITSTYAPEVDVLQAIDGNQIVHVMLPALERSEVAHAFARLLLGDLRSALAELYRRAPADRSAVPFLVLMDEFGSYASPVVAPTFEMARGARVALMPMFQTLSGLRAGGPDLIEQVIGNVEVILVMGVADLATADTAARLFGQARQAFASRTRSRSRGAGNRNLAFELFHATSFSEGESVSMREAYDYRVRPEAFMALPPGQAWLRAGASPSVFHLRLPQIEAPRIGEFALHPVTVTPRAGIGPLLDARPAP